MKIDHAWGSCETFAETNCYQLRMLKVSRGWKVGFVSHPGGNKAVVVANGAIVLLNQDGHKQFLGNGNIVGVGHNSVFAVCLEDTAFIEITHGIVGPDVDCKYVGWHISYRDPLNKIMSIHEGNELNGQ